MSDDKPTLDGLAVRVEAIEEAIGLDRPTVATPPVEVDDDGDTVEPPTLWARSAPVNGGALIVPGVTFGTWDEETGAAVSGTFLDIDKGAKSVLVNAGDDARHPLRQYGIVDLRALAQKLQWLRSEIARLSPDIPETPVGAPQRPPSVLDGQSPDNGPETPTGAPSDYLIQVLGPRRVRSDYYPASFYQDPTALAHANVAASPALAVKGEAPYKPGPDDWTEIKLDKADRTEGRGATGLHEAFLPVLPARQARFSITVEFVDTPELPFHPGKTGKIGGLVGFNTPEWDQWPGGGRHGRANFSVRNVWNNWSGTWRHGTYVYTGVADWDGANLGPHKVNYTSNNGHTREFLHDRPMPAVNRPTKIVNEIDTETTTDGRGRIVTIIDGVKALDISNVPLHSEGLGYLTHAYLSFMYGGVDPNYGPDTTQGACIVRYRDVTVERFG